MFQPAGMIEQSRRFGVDTAGGSTTQQSNQELSMTRMKLFAATLLASTLLAAPAMAEGAKPMDQQPAATQDQKPMATPDKKADKPMTSPSTAAVQTQQQAGQWRASKFVGLDVYNASNEKIGDINELIMGDDGQIDLVVIGVGGFLGMGEHDVALKWDQIKFVNEPVRSTTTSNTRPATGTAARPGTTTGTAATAPVNAANANKDYPDHAVVDMTKDQLKALPQFKYASATR
jgi:hypothetical protein